MAFVEADEAGDVCVFTYAAAHVIVDIQSELVTEHQLGLVVGRADAQSTTHVPLSRASAGASAGTSLRVRPCRNSEGNP